MMKRIVVAVLLLSFAATAAAAAASTLPADMVKDLSFHQHPGARLPLEATFRDEGGELVRLGDFFRGKPVVLVLEYLRCRTLCGFVLQDLAKALAQSSLAGGRDYQVVAVSIDPRDGAAEARAARTTYVARFGKADASGWHFLTGADRAIADLADTAGFPFRYDSAIDQYAHPAGLVIAAPDGTIARYILGLDYRPLDLRLALAEAAGGTIASPASELLLLCYCYDPGTGRYSLAINNITRILCGATVLGVGILVVRLVRGVRS
jgi:protein SCO1